MTTSFRPVAGLRDVATEETPVTLVGVLEKPLRVSGAKKVCNRGQCDET